ncbi:MAG: succinylglutamate desuccinylase/aspartoacylase family protein [SAR324 cluster bacterium]|nr:succinylglutamate desuccinylase/aspartoacylase family protein [SAR324 cluster bacterium]
MIQNSTPVRIWENPLPTDVGNSIEDFLSRLGGPTLLYLRGEDHSRIRAVSTLLHGNEPSGVRAVRHWIRSGQKPAVDLLCFVGSVNAALAAPKFTHRALPCHQDLNRCFLPPFHGEEGQIAESLMQQLLNAKPEALIDIHNTSGRGPAYGLSLHEDDTHKALVSLFADTLVITHLRLGTLMEMADNHFPTITIECGGARDPDSHAIALKGLERYATAESVLSLDGVWMGDVLNNPARLELRDGAKVAYARSPEPDVELTLPEEVEEYNFGILNPREMFGWLGPLGLKMLAVYDAEGKDVLHDYFTEHNGCLFAARPLKLFMVTTNPEIAESDCLCYVVAAD